MNVTIPFDGTADCEVVDEGDGLLGQALCSSLVLQDQLPPFVVLCQRCGQQADGLLILFSLSGGKAAVKSGGAVVKDVPQQIECHATNGGRTARHSPPRMPATQLAKERLQASVARL